MAVAAPAVAIVHLRSSPPTLIRRPSTFSHLRRGYAHDITFPSWVSRPREPLPLIGCLKDISNGESTEERRRGDSTMPDRFRHLLKEAPDPPIRWPWAIVLGFIVYAWRAVFRELGNYKKAVMGIIGFSGYLGKLLLATIFHFIGDPLIRILQFIESCIYTLWDIYKRIITYAPVPKLMGILFFSFTVMSIAEAVAPDSVNRQQILLLLASIVAYGAFLGFIPRVLYWLSLSGFFCYSYFIEKKDALTAALPSATVLVAVGDPWLRFVILSLYMALAVNQQMKSSETVAQDASGSDQIMVPVPLQLIAFSIGVHVAAKCVRQRHLTWMIS